MSLQASQAEKKSTITALPDALINFRQLRLFGVQAGDVDLYDGDDISKVRIDPTVNHHLRARWSSESALP